MGTPQQEQYPKLRCRKCESVLNRPKCADQTKYSIVPTDHGAVVRQCLGCSQWWLGYMQELPNQTMKIILKMIDKVL